MIGGHDSPLKGSLNISTIPKRSQRSNCQGITSCWLNQLVETKIILKLDHSPKQVRVLGCPRKWSDQWWTDQWVISPILINGRYILGVKSPTDPITFDPITSFPGHPSGRLLGVLPWSLWQSNAASHVQASTWRWGWTTCAGPQKGELQWVKNICIWYIYI